jgi:glycosidase
MSTPVIGKQEIIYHILIDRFAGFPPGKKKDLTDFVGGTLNGIRSKLPYLKDLGVTTLWISPFYKTSAYHGYHITDFYSVDPHFGTEKDLVNLINSVHDEQMHIIADFVPNHCSKSHPFFQEATQHEKSPYRNWFCFADWPKKYLRFLSVDELPKINLSYEPARQHIIDASLYWLGKGLDGFRLDHVIGPSHQFWKQFSQRIKQDYPQVTLIGEAWMQGISFQELTTVNTPWKHLKWLLGSSSDWLLGSYQSVLDGVLDFTGQQLIQHALHHSVSQKNLKKAFKHHFKKYDPLFLLPLFLDNHDMDRFLFLCGNDKNRLKQAASFQFSLPQPVIIYYGTEVGMSQNQSIWSQPSHGDRLAREPMAWDAIDEDLLGFYQELIQKRKKNRS